MKLFIIKRDLQVLIQIKILEVIVLEIELIKKLVRVNYQ